MPEINVIPTVSEASPLDAYKRQILAAQLMQKQASDGSQPIYNAKAGWAKVLQGIAGGASEGMAERDEAGKQQITQGNIAKYVDMLSGGGATPSAPADASATGPATPAASAPPMGALPGMSAPIPPMSNRVYDQNEMNPMDAAVATPQELSVGVNAPAKYAALLGKTAIDNDIPANVLAAQTKQESGFNPNSVSSAGALGISQFMPGTAKEMGINPLDPNQAIPAQGQYLRQQLDKFGGSMPLALAAYNAGPGRVANSGGDISKLPAETQGYVKSITGAAGAPPDRASVMAQQLSPQPGTAVSDRQRALASQLIADPRTPAAVKTAIIGQMNPTYGFQTLPDGTILRTDPRHGTVTPVYQGTAKPTTDVQNFEYSQNHPDFAGYQQSLKKASANSINIDQKGEGEFSKVAGKEQATRFNDLAADGPAAKQMISDVQTLTQLGSAIGTGKGAQVRQALGPYADALGIKVDGLSDIQAFDAIVNRVAPNLRVKGSGAQSDFELRNFLKSLPSLGNTEGGNAIASQVMQGLYQNKLKASQIGADALNGKISRDDAEKQLRELPDPMEGYRSFMKELKHPAGSPGQPVQVSTPDEARKLPKGTPIILPDGSQGVVP